MNATTEQPVAIFMSADVVGSTAFKASAVDAQGRALWLEAFETLFRELPLIFIGQVAAAGMAYDDVPECGVWKVLGDEVVFIGMPKHLDDAAILAVAFLRTVVAADQRLASRWPLRIRGSFWAAALGERNRKIDIPEMFGGSKGRPYRDFLGPDVDIGFRLSGHAGSGQVIVSPNLVESLAPHAGASTLRFHAIGEKSLKGVCGGQPFPLILMSTPDPRNADPAAPWLGAPSDHPAAESQALAQALAARRAALMREHGAQMAPPVFCA